MGRELAHGPVLVSALSVTLPFTGNFGCFESIVRGNLHLFGK